MLAHNLGHSPRGNKKQGPTHRRAGRDRRKRRAGCSTSENGSWLKKGTSYKAHLGWSQHEEISTLSGQNPNVYRGLNRVQSHIHCPGDVNNTFLSQGCILEIAPSVGTG